MMLIDFFDVCANYRSRLTKKCSRTLAVRVNSGILLASRRSIIKTRQSGVYGRSACHYALAQLDSR